MYVTAQGKAFKATPTAFAAMSSMVAPAPFSESGVLLGWNPIARGLGWVDLPQMQLDGITNGQQVQVIAPRRHGKSGALKAVSYREVGVQAGRYGPKRVKPSKVEVNDRKPEGREGQGEWTLWGRATAAEFVVVSELPSLNTFAEELGLGEAQTHEFGIKVCEFAGDRSLNEVERWVMLVAVRKMREDPDFMKIPGTDTLKFLLQTLTAEDRDKYYRDSDQEFMNNHAEILTHDPELQARIRHLSDLHLRPKDAYGIREREAAIAEFLEAKRHLAILIGNAMEGEFGRVIGGKNSPLEFLRANRRVIDWTGTSRNTQGILEFWFSLLHEVAMKNPALDIIPDARFSDEDRSADSVIYLRTKLERMEKARALPTGEWSTVQFEKGVEMTIGDVGSAKRGIARLIDLGYAMRLIGKQPNNQKYLAELSDTYNIPDHIIEWTPKLQQGDWLVWFNGHREVQLIRVFLTPAELAISVSDSAAEGKVNRADIVEEFGYVPAIMQDEYIEWLLQQRRSYNINPNLN